MRVAGQQIMEGVNRATCALCLNHFPVGWKPCIAILSGTFFGIGFRIAAVFSAEYFRGSTGRIARVGV
jgi:hypothetical protein